MPPAPSPQIPLDLIPPEAPALHNFVVGHNAESLHRLQQLALGQQSPHDPRTLVLWGGPGVGKSHLLRALDHALRQRGQRVHLHRAPAPLPDDPFIDLDYLLIDDADQLDPHGQGWLFTAYNHLQARGGTLLATGARPPAQWPHRDDIRSRMGSGLVLEIAPIPQQELPAALEAYARSRGFQISPEVLNYLLTHHTRDLGPLCAAIREVDRLSLAQRRPITVPLLKTLLKP